MNKKELKNNEKLKNKKSTKAHSNLISNHQLLTSNHQPLISDHRGITLIALVITIIVMLILVGVTVTIALDGGLFTQAKDAARKTQIANIKERVQADIWEKEAENKGGGITVEQFQEVLDKYFDGVPETADSLQEELTKNSDYSLGTKEEYGPKVEIKVSDLYNGTLAKEDSKPPEELGDSANTETSYLGYYADVDGDGEEDGIIYADLAFAGNGQWYDGIGNYSWTAETGSLKQYEITDKKASSFGDVERDVIKAVDGSNGEDRFYVMALKDVDESTHYWYKSAYNKLTESEGTSHYNLGLGKENTKKMIDKWNASEYGIQDNNDMWKIIQNKEEFPLFTDENGKWFVPSRAEWAAFGALVSQTEKPRLWSY